MKMVLENACRFHLGDEPDAWQAWFDDSAWQEVYLPHDWSVGLPFSKEYSSGTGYLAGGIGWYRIPITPKKEWEGKRISITFDGVYKNSRVWCNSYYLGERPNGYISFTYDITGQFHFDCENVIAVYVDRREIADSRWFTGSGITRKVTLNIEEEVHPVPDGIFFSTPKVSREEALVQIESEWINAANHKNDIGVIFELHDPNGEVVAKASANLLLDANETGKNLTQMSVKIPKLWSPAIPNLYQLLVYETIDRDTVLAASIPVGIRWFSFDANEGFLLNGNPYKLKGVCVHHDAGVLGAAVFKEVWYRRLTRLKEMGCNAIRMSHNPHMPELYELCDEMGFFVMDEAFDEWEGPKNKWSTGHNVYPPKHQGYYVNFHTWGKKDLEDMIRRDRNHPCVILWSIGNEIDYPNDPYCHESFSSMTGNNDANKPAAERQFNPKRPNATRLSYLSKYLCDIVKQTDSTHPVTLAAAFPELSAGLGFIDPLDVVGYNYKEHLYEQHHKEFPDKPFLGSENGHSYEQWRHVTDKPYISGQFLWTGIDYLGEAHGWPIHGSGAGLLTLAGFEKTGYYRRQSFWSSKPMVHLAAIREEESKTTVWGQECESAIACEFSAVSELWNYLPGEKIVVKCYTNQHRVRLYLNEKDLGIFEKADRADCILATIPFEKGELRAVALDEKEEPAAEHSLFTTGAPCKISIREYEIPSYISKHVRQFEISVLDEADHVCFDAENLLHVKTKGVAWVGLENGNLADVTEYTSKSRRAYRGKLMLYVDALHCEEEICIEITSEGLKSANLNVQKQKICCCD